MKTNEFEAAHVELPQGETGTGQMETVVLPQVAAGTDEAKKGGRSHYLGSTLWKVLGIVGMCVLEVLIVVAAFVASWETYGDGHPQTEVVRQRMVDEVYEVVSELYEGRTTNTDASQTNLRYLIAQVEPDGTQKVLLDTIGDDAVTDAATGAADTTSKTALQKETFWLGYNPESSSPWLMTEQDVKEMSGSDWGSFSVYHCTVLLVTPFTAKDGFSDLYSMGALVNDYGQAALPAIVCLAALFVLVLVYEFCAAGHREGEDGIVLTSIDRFPFDLLTVIVVLLIAFFAPAGLLVLGEAFNVADYGTQMLGVLCGTVLGFTLVVFAYLMSMARRVKAGTLMQGTAIAWIWRQVVRICEFFRALIPGFWQRLLVLALYLLIQLDAALVKGGGAGTAFFLASVAIAAVALHSLWMQDQVCTAAKEICGGNLSYQISDKTLGRMYGDMREQAENLNHISDTVSRAVDERVRSERLKTELIANVGHDIRTPLTSITNYVDLLSRDHTLEQEREYLAVLARQTERLRKLTEDVLESSKADSGNVEVHLERTSVAEIVDQAYGEYEDRMAAAELETVIDVPENLYVTADGRLLWRVLRNLLSNAAKYSAPRSRVYISAWRMDGMLAADTGVADATEIDATKTCALVSIEIKNVSRERLNISADELMERFVRGDSSRHSEGSGLGLDIARSLSGLMGGRLDIQIDGDLFKAAVLLPAAE